MPEALATPCPLDLTLPDGVPTDGIQLEDGRLIPLEEIPNFALELLQLPQLQLPVKHYFAPGVYVREFFMPAGSFIIGHKHATEHLNIVQQGSADVIMNGMVYEVRGPVTFSSKAGTQKVLKVHTDMIWLTVHPTEERDIEVLEQALKIEPFAVLFPEVTP